jgi:hypothetical protein
MIIEREKMNTETITISKTAGEATLRVLTMWLEYVEDLTAETRAEIIALDELIKALDAEESYQQKIEQSREQARRLNEEYQQRRAQEAESAGE